jgi:hypothetical protein
LKRIRGGSPSVWEGDFRDDALLSDAKKDIENAWSTKDERVEIEFADHGLEDSFGSIDRAEQVIMILILDPQFEFEFPDGHKEQRRVNQDIFFTNLGVQFPGQIYEFFDDSGNSIDGRKQLKAFRGKSAIHLRIQYGFQSDCAIANPIRRSFEARSPLSVVVRDLLKKDPSGTVVKYDGKSYDLEDEISSIPYADAGLIELLSPYALPFEVRQNRDSPGRVFTLVLNPVTTVADLPLEEFPELFGDVICGLHQGPDRLHSDVRLYGVCSVNDRLIVSQEAFRTCDIEHCEECDRDRYETKERKRSQIDLTDTIDAAITKNRPPDYEDRDFFFRADGVELNGDKVFVEVVPRGIVAQLCLRWRQYGFSVEGERWGIRYDDTATILDARVDIEMRLPDKKTELEQITIAGYSDGVVLRTLYERNICFEVQIRDPLYHFPDPIKDRRFPRATTVLAAIAKFEKELEQRVEFDLAGYDDSAPDSVLYDHCNRERRVPGRVTPIRYPVTFPDGTVREIEHSLGDTVAVVTAAISWKDHGFVYQKGTRNPIRHVHVRRGGSDGDSAGELAPDQPLWPIIRARGSLWLSFDVEVQFEDRTLLLSYDHGDRPDSFEYAVSELCGCPVSLQSPGAFDGRRLAPVAVVRSRHPVYRFAHSGGILYRRLRQTTLVREALAILAVPLAAPARALELLDGIGLRRRRDPLGAPSTSFTVRRRELAKFRFCFGPNDPISVRLPLDATVEDAAAALRASPPFAHYREIAFSLFGRPLAALTRTDAITVECVVGEYFVDGEPRALPPSTKIRALAPAGSVVKREARLCRPDQALADVCEPGAALVTEEYQLALGGHYFSGYTTVAEARRDLGLDPGLTIAAGGRGLPGSAFLAEHAGLAIVPAPPCPRLRFESDSMAREFTFADDATVEEATIALEDAAGHPRKCFELSVEGNALSSDERLAWVAGGPPLQVRSPFITLVHQKRRAPRAEFPAWVETQVEPEDGPVGEALTGSDALADPFIFTACASVSSAVTRATLERLNRRVVVVVRRSRGSTSGGGADYRMEWLMFTMYRTAGWTEIELRPRSADGVVQKVKPEKGMTFAQVKGKLAERIGIPPDRIALLRFTQPDATRAKQFDLVNEEEMVTVRDVVELEWIEVPERIERNEEHDRAIREEGMEVTEDMRRLYLMCDQDRGVFHRALAANRPPSGPRAPTR